MESLIDFRSNAVAAPNMQQVPPSSDGGNQSSDELSSKGKAPPASNANSLEFLMFDLSAPSVGNFSAVQGTSGAPSTASRQNVSLDSVSPATPAEQFLALASTIGSSPGINVPQEPSNVSPLRAKTDINCDYRVKAPEGHVFPSVQKQPSPLFSDSDNSFSKQKCTSRVEVLNSQVIIGV